MCYSDDENCDDNSSYESSVYSDNDDYFDYCETCNLIHCICDTDFDYCETCNLIHCICDTDFDNKQKCEKEQERIINKSELNRLFGGYKILDPTIFQCEICSKTPSEKCGCCLTCKNDAISCVCKCPCCRNSVCSCINDDYVIQLNRMDGLIKRKKVVFNKDEYIDECDETYLLHLRKCDSCNIPRPTKVEFIQMSRRNYFVGYLLTNINSMFGLTKYSISINDDDGYVLCSIDSNTLECFDINIDKIFTQISTRRLLCIDIVFL